MAQFNMKQTNNYPIVYNIQFDNESIHKEFTEIVNVTTFDKINFGVLHIKVNKTTPTLKKRHIVFTTDCSGSMSDICNDGKTKMDHSNHTLINMIIYFANHPELSVSVSVYSFDGNVYTIFENIEINKENLDILIQDIKNIRPKDTTNIEKALKNSNEYISNIISKNNDIDITHIFMTDGDATQGNSNPEILKSLINPLVPTIFIGFGIDHNACLLKELSSINKNNYYFVDALEKAGLVYGEILHAFIYKILENTNITVTNGLLYDWKKNKWVDKLILGDLVSETNKTIHILSENPINFTCVIESTDCSTKEIHNLTVENILTMDENKNINGFEDLSKYKYRQRTQQLLFEVNVHNFNNMRCYDPLKFSLYGNDYDTLYSKQNKNGAVLKEKMHNLLKEMTPYKEDQFIKVLCDDIYVCLKTFETKYSAMYSCARQVSQGAQRSYSANHSNIQNTCIDNTNNIGISFPRFTMKRSYACNYDIQEIEDFQLDNLNLNMKMLPDIEEEPSISLSLNRPSTDSNITFNNNNNNNNHKIRDIDYDYNSEDALDNYTVSDQTDNPYVSESILELMRSCSANSNENNLLFK
jgi:hypothetical protein